MSVFDVGDLVRVSGPFTVGGVATDPTTVSLAVKDPSGNVATYTYAAGEIIRDSQGNYHKDVSADEAGIWSWYWAGTGAVETAGEGYFEVRKKLTS